MSNRSIYWGITVVATLVVAYLGKKYLSDPSEFPSGIPLRASEAAIQRDVEEFKGALAKLRSQANEICVKLAQDTIADDFLSIDEERSYLDNTIAAVESIKRRSPESALRDGFVFHFPHPPDQKVTGFSLGIEE